MLRQPRRRSVIERLADGGQRIVFPVADSRLEVFEASTNRHDPCRPNARAPTKGVGNHAVVGLVAPERHGPKAEVVLLGVFVTSRVAFREKASIGQVREERPGLRCPISLRGRACPDIQLPFTAEQTARAITGAVREAAAGCQTSELQVDAVARDQRDASSFDRSQRGLEGVGVVRLKCRLFLLSCLAQQVGTALLRVRDADARKARQHEKREISERVHRSCLIGDDCTTWTLTDAVPVSHHDIGVSPPTPRAWAAGRTRPVRPRWRRQRPGARPCAADRIRRCVVRCSRCPPCRSRSADVAAPLCPMRLRRQNACPVGRRTISLTSTSAGWSMANAMARATELAGIAVL